MERIETQMGGGGGSVGGSTVSREEAIVAAAVGEEQSSNSETGCGSSPEVSSYPDGAGLELGLGLSLGGSGGGGRGGGSRVVVNGNNNPRQLLGPRILTAKDLPSMGSTGGLNPSPSTVSSSSSSSRGVYGAGNFHGFSSAGTKRAADSVTSAGVSQVVGWPPIRAYRMNSLSNQAKSLAMGEFNLNAGESKGNDISCVANKCNAICNEIGHARGSLFVKVNMDGIGIGRKVDLNAHSCYESLAQTLEEMFTIPSKKVYTLTSNREDCGLMSKANRSSRLLDGLSNFMLTYEDKDGDWMLVGDVPWGLFLGSVKRLRIMKASEANGLDSRFEERTCKQRTRLI